MTTLKNTTDSLVKLIEYIWSIKIEIRVRIGDLYLTEIHTSIILNFKNQGISGERHCQCNLLNACPISCQYNRLKFHSHYHVFNGPIKIL